MGKSYHVWGEKKKIWVGLCMRKRIVARDLQHPIIFPGLTRIKSGALAPPKIAHRAIEQVFEFFRLRRAA